MESHEPFEQSLKPTEALDTIRATQSGMAYQAEAPAWYAVSLSLISGGFLAVQAAPLALRVAGVAVLAAAIPLLVEAYRRKTGIWMDGFRPGRTRKVAVAAVVLALSVFAVGCYFGFVRNRSEAFLIGGAIISVITFVASIAWGRAYAREMEANP